MRFVTTQGSFDVELFESQAPVTVANFIARVKTGYYRDSLLHRLVPGVLVQGGTYTSQWQFMPGAEPIPNEGDNGLSNSKWTVAMSSVAENLSSATEFFVNLGDNDDFDKASGNSLRHTCVFGEVSEGHDTLRRMMEAGVISGGDFVGDRPAQDIVISDILLLTDN